MVVLVLDDAADEAIELLTGVPAGQLDEQGKYPMGTVNQRVAARLDELFEIRQQLSKNSTENNEP